MPLPASPALLGVLALGGLLLLAPRFLARASGALRMTVLLRRARVRRAPDPARTAAYHAYRREQPPGWPHDGAVADGGADVIDDRTWADLDLDAVFLALDHTASEPGRQALYHRLRTPQPDRALLAQFERAVQEFAADDVADRARAPLARLADPRAGQLVNLFFGELPARPRLWWAFPLLTAGSVACLALFLSGAWPPAAVWWVALCAVNVLAQLAYRPRVKRFIPALHQLRAFLDVATALADPPAGGTVGATDDALAAERRMLGDGARRLRALRQATWWLRFEPGETNELAASVYEYVNLAFLLDVNAFVLAVDTLRARRGELRAMFEAIGAIDAAQSVAAWRRTLPRWTVPAFTASTKALTVEGLTHPLVDGAVPNALALDGTGALVTGSNMAGKSTLVRALGVSAVLARTLHTACADVWRGPPLRVRTAIGRADSVVEGKSYYLAEAEAVLALVRAAEGDAPHLFLLDEVFRGTNTDERVAAAYAVLAHLIQGPHLVVAATHDFELLALLGDAYAPYHFREHVAGGALRFDYRLRPGPSSTRNAIALLAALGYPASVVAAAGAVAERRRAGGTDLAEHAGAAGPA